MEIVHYFVLESISVHAVLFKITAPNTINNRLELLSWQIELMGRAWGVFMLKFQHLLSLAVVVRRGQPLRGVSPVQKQKGFPSQWSSSLCVPSSLWSMLPVLIYRMMESTGRTQVGVTFKQLGNDFFSKL